MAHVKSATRLLDSLGRFLAEGLPAGNPWAVLTAAFLAAAFGVLVAQGTP
jgi:hypothetical protein